MRLGVLIVLIAAPAAFGFQLLSEDAIHQAVEEFVLSEMNPEPAAETKIQVRWHGELVIDCTESVDIQVRSISPRPFRGQTMARVSMMCGGKSVKTIAVTVDTRFHKEVLVAKRQIRRHETLSEQMVELAMRDVTSLKGGYFTGFEQLVDNRTKRSVGVGAALSADHVEPVPVIMRGDDVALVVEGDGIWISAGGVAIQDGGVGSRIRVRNRDSGRIVQGTVLDRGTVAIGL